MRRFIFTMGCVLLLSQSAFASFTYKNSCIGVTNSPANSISCTIVGTTVSSGDLVVAFAGWATNGLTVSVSDGTSTFTGGAQNSPSGAWSNGHGQFFYILSSIATGTPTYTFTAVGAYAPDIVVYVFTPSGAVTFDSPDVATAGGISTSVNSGTITTTGSDQLVIGAFLAENGPTPSAWAIGGSSASTNATYGYNGGFTISEWYLATAGTVAATATLSGSQKWVSNEIGFKIAGGGGGGTVVQRRGLSPRTGTRSIQ